MWKIAVWLLLMICGVASVVIFANFFRVRERRRKLTEIGCVATWTDITRNPTSIAQIVEINFGYGQEIWVLSSAEDDIDLKQRKYKRGRVILPRPDPRELQQFCHTRSLKMVYRQVKQ